MRKDCYNCNNFDETNDIFVACNKLDDDNFMVFLEISYKNYENWKEEDIECDKWESNGEL